jgi:hypothetical protein
MSSPTKASDQSKRFIEAARELDTDESPEAFERVFAKVVPPKKGAEVTPPKSKKPSR